MKIKIARDNDRSIKVQGRLSDKSGHSGILTMITELFEDNWSEQSMVATAFSYMYQEWQREQGKIIPLSPSQVSMTGDMIEMLREARELHKAAFDALQAINSGNFTLVEQSNLRNAVDNFNIKPSFITIEGIANSSSELVENQEDDFEDWA